MTKPEKAKRYKRGPLLFALSLLLFCIVGPLALLYTILKFVVGFYLEFLVMFGGLLYWLAYSIDQLGNVLCQHLFNDILIKKGGFKFGDPDFTISAVLGLNKRSKTLKPLGAWLCMVLNWIDPEHVEKAADSEKCK